jgi:DNA-binding NarL/FixJ family response regulator
MSRSRKELLPPRDAKRAELVPPRGARVSNFAIGEEYFVLSYPIAVATFPSTLTPAEQAVAGRIVEGASFREIGKERGTSQRTIANQAKAIYRKLGVGSRLELAAFALRLSRAFEKTDE